MIPMNTLIIGCGSIGACKPDLYDFKGRSPALTHAHAMRKCSWIQEIGFVDEDYNKAKQAACKWKGIAFETLVNGLDKLRPSLVTIAVPTEEHYQVYRDAVDLSENQAMIILEKPVGVNLSEAEGIERLANHYGNLTMVNYSRNYLPPYRALKTDLLEGRYGEIRSCRLLYGRGLYREASHFLALAGEWFGKLLFSQALFGSEIYDLVGETGSTPDFSTGAVLVFQKCPLVYLQPADGRDFSIFEIEIITSKGILRLVEHGKYLYQYPLIPEPVYGNYSTVSSEPAIRDMRLEKSLEYLYETAGWLWSDPEAKDLSQFVTLESAVEVQKILNRILPR